MDGDSAREKAARARAKAERLARYADNWEKGAEGESQTAAALRSLGPGWVVWHDLKWPGRPRANIDHLVIGPGGIFVIDSKNWSGSITATDNVLRQNGYRREDAVASCAESALAVGSLAPQYLGHVHPVVCFARDEYVHGWARDVMLCSTANVVEMLVTRPPALTLPEVGDAVNTLHSRLRSMPTGGTASHRRRPPRRTRARPSTRRRTMRARKRAPLWLRLIYLSLSLVLFALAAEIISAIFVAIANSSHPGR